MFLYHLSHSITNSLFSKFLFLLLSFFSSYLLLLSSPSSSLLPLIATLMLIASSHLLSTPSPPLHRFTCCLLPFTSPPAFVHFHSPPTFFPSFLCPCPSPFCPPGPAPPPTVGPASLGVTGSTDGRAAAVAAPPVTWSRDALQHGGAVGPRHRFLTGRRGRTRPVPAGTPGPQPRSPARSRRPPAGLPALAGSGPCRRARPRACSCPGPWRRS